LSFCFTQIGLKSDVNQLSKQGKYWPTGVIVAVNGVIGKKVALKNTVSRMFFSISLEPKTASDYDEKFTLLLNSCA